MLCGVSGKGKADLIDHHVGKRLKTRRILLGLSQQDLGDAVNVSIQQIQKYEKATNRISSGKLYALSQLLQVPISYFFDNNANADSDGADLPEREVVLLVHSYKEIKDPKIRQKIMDFIKTVAEQGESLSNT